MSRLDAMVDGICLWVRKSLFDKMFFKPHDPDTKIINHPYAKAVTPDDLISAYCVASIARNFDDWTRTENWLQYKQPCHQLTPSQRPKGVFRFVEIVIENKKKEIKLTYKLTAYNNYADLEECSNFKVNGVEINDVAGEDIRQAYNKVAEARRKIEAEAKRLAEKMAHDQKKWDIAEKLLGMKRLPNGALVPKESAACLKARP